MSKKTVKHIHKDALHFYILDSKIPLYDYDTMSRCIVYAKNAKQARQLAQNDGGDECRDNKHNEVSFWTDPKQTTCQLLTSVYKNESTAQMVIAETLDG